MRKHQPKTIFQILLFSIAIVVLSNIWGHFLNAEPGTTTTLSEWNNNALFTPIDQPKLILTGVAIGTSISSKDWDTVDQQKNVLNTIFSSTGLMNLSEEEKQDLISYNMELSQEYKNILNSDIPGIIRGSYNKRSTITALLDQLEYRYITTRDQVELLNSQRTSLLSDMTEINGKIEALKTKINSDFSKNDASASTQNIETYLELKREFFFARTYVVYINHFLGQIDLILFLPILLLVEKKKILFNKIFQSKQMLQKCYFYNIFINI